MKNKAHEGWMPRFVVGAQVDKGSQWRPSIDRRLTCSVTVPIEPE